ncbi:DUF3131 domain-containing protein [Noviherbaspirillum sp. CPCC 100848]|uniref:DUF3131 domain-containing protein n=1 Tax=Noviherbaspirillum album TaxID=3080276 RepID=A0ABU6JEE7_9BURK|nr:DUF3131 domain-containing protein [Noviherbaspirillum sp. CPCC 100848]MEC4721903.1 DUF3131 domain-containing protein [Noviherbaspirillum sp. CPCC 100848]
MNKENLLRARSNIVFILALAVGFALVMWIEKHSGPPQAGSASANAQGARIQYSSDMPAPAEPKPLSDQEREWARIAWKYFDNNTDPKTGLVNSVDKYQAATMWDTGSTMLALISAHRLDLLAEKEFDARMSKLLDSLAGMPLYDNLLPNKSYSTATLEMVDYTGKPAAQGIGWSAIDIGRMLVPLTIVAWNFPQHTEAARRVVGRWQLARMSRDGALVGVHETEGGKLELLQEGRLGYEQYAAKAAALLGTDAAEALDYKAQLEFADVYGIKVPHDRRDARTSGGHNYVVSEPYLLDGLEFGGDRISREFAWRVFRAQEERFRQTGKLTAVTEDHVDQAPYFVYNTVFSNGKTWNTLTEKGEDAGRLRSLSVKAAFGWHALYRNDYSGKLIKEVAALYDPQRGWYAGKYEEGGAANKALTANTNAVVLESLAYIAGGRLLGHAQGEKP